MKKIVILLLCLVLLFLGACQQTPAIKVIAPPEDESAETPQVSAQPLATPSPNVTMLPPPPTPTITAAPTPTLPPTPAPTPAGPAMYTSEALFVSFDPVTGIAAFDYIEVLQGDDAVDYMVAYQGKTPQEAQDIVDGWADSEAIEKNHNPQLRMIDMDGPAITMLWYPNGDEDFSLNGVSFSYQDFVTLYTNHPDKVDWYWFYRIEVDGTGNVTHVEQVYWP